MSGPGSDIVDLFRAPDPGSAFRQGEILTFNAATGANTVRVGGAVLTDLAILVGGDTVNLAPGNAVIVLKFGSSWAILGRIVIPGAETLSAAAVGFGGTGASALNYAVNASTAGYGTIVSGNIAVPAWANQANVLAIASSTAANTNGSSVNTDLWGRVRIAGVSGGENTVYVLFGQIGQLTMHASRSNLAVSPGGSFTIDAQLYALGPSWPASASNITNLDAIVIFRRI